MENVKGGLRPAVDKIGCVMMMMMMNRPLNV